MNDEQLLIKRKKDALSSYVSESEFSKTFLTNNIIYTEGWWYSKDTDENQYFFIHKNTLSDFDIELISKFKDITNNIFQIIINGEDILIKDLNTSQEISLEDFVKEHQLSNRRESNENKLNIKEKKRYLEYFKKLNILDHVKESVFVEDEFLNKYFVSINIDFILKNSSGILLLEVKYKYKDKSGNFGMNKMQYEFLNLLQSKKMFAFNIILDNTDRIDIIDRINNNQCHWIYHRLEQNLTEVKTAPARTGYFTNRPQQYYVLDGDEYVELKVEANFINMKCPQCGNKLLLRMGKYGSFLGCEKYGKTKCKGTLKI